MRIAFIINNLIDIRQVASIACYLKHDKYLLLNHRVARHYDKLSISNLEFLGCKVIDLYSSANIPKQGFDMSFCTPIFLAHFMKSLNINGGFIKKKFGYLVGLSWGWDTMRDSYFKSLNMVDCLVSESSQFIQMGKKTRERLTQKRFDVKFAKIMNSLKIVYSHPYYDPWYVPMDKDSIYAKYGIEDNDKEKALVLESKIKLGGGRWGTTHISQIRKRLKKLGYNILFSRKMNIPGHIKDSYDANTIYQLLELAQVCDFGLITKEGRGVTEIVMADKPLYYYDKYMTFNSKGRYKLFHKYIKGLALTNYNKIGKNHKIVPASKSNQSWLNKWVTMHDEGNVAHLTKALEI